MKFQVLMDHVIGMLLHKAKPIMWKLSEFQIEKWMFSKSEIFLYSVLLSVFVDRAWSNMLEELLIYTALALDSR
jgi:hypothetical protein